MTSGPDVGWDDEKLVEYFRKSAIMQYEYGFGSPEANVIDDDRLTPCYKILSDRGRDSLRKLIPLTEDSNPNVQLSAAFFGFDAAPDVCRRTLQRLMRDDRVGVIALVLLAHKDPGFAAEFEELAALGHDRCEEEMTRRYGPRR